MHTNTRGKVSSRYECSFTIFSKRLSSSGLPILSNDSVGCAADAYLMSIHCTRIKLVYAHDLNCALQSLDGLVDVAMLLLGMPVGPDVARRDLLRTAGRGARVADSGRVGGGEEVEGSGEEERGEVDEGEHEGQQQQPARPSGR